MHQQGVRPSIERIWQNFLELAFRYSRRNRRHSQDSAVAFLERIGVKGGLLSSRLPVVLPVRDAPIIYEHVLRLL